MCYHTWKTKSQKTKSQKNRSTSNGEFNSRIQTLTPTKLDNHEAPHPLYSLVISSSLTQSHHYHIAVTNFIETYNNRVNILSFDLETLSLSLKPFHPSLSFDHPYPPTKLMFHPIATSSSSSPSNPNPNLLASSDDFICLWDLRNHSIEPLCVLNNSKNFEFCTPLTSFDWNEVEPKRIGRCSINMTCMGTKS